MALYAKIPKTLEYYLPKEESKNSTPTWKSLPKVGKKVA